MRFTVLAAPGSDSMALASRAAAVVAVDGPESVAAAARAAHTGWIVLVGRGVRVRPGALAGLAAPEPDLGVAGGALWTAADRRYGFMLAPARGVLPFEPVPIVLPAAAGSDALARGPVDVATPELLLAQAPLLHAALPADALAAAVELCARARERELAVRCRPAFAAEAPPEPADDRGRRTGLLAVARARPELHGRHRLAPALRPTTIDRDVRLEGGRRVRQRREHPPIALLVHGDGAERAARAAAQVHPAVTSCATVADAAGLRSALRVRGDRYALLCAAGRVPSAAQIEDLVEAIESWAGTAAAAANAGDLAGGCVLFALGRIPAHVAAAGTTIEEGARALVEGASRARRTVAAPGFRPPPPPAARGRAGLIFLAGSIPEITRMSLDATLAASGMDDELVAVCAGGALTTQRLLGAYPHVRVELDAGDPVLGSAANRALGEARGDLVVLIADDVVLAPGALDRMRAAFDRVPALGAAFPCVPGAATPEGVADVRYADLPEMRALAETRARAFPRMSEPLELAASPVVAFAREALDQVGGLSPVHGPTRAGIADLILRLRAAGYAVARCDDALAHRFDAAVSQNVAALADAGTPVPVADPARVAAGFDPAARVPFVALAAVAAPGTAAIAIALPVDGASELERAASFVAAAAAQFDAASPVRVHLLIVGALGAADVVARIRPALARSGKPLDATVNVKIERAPDLAAWRAALEPGVRVLVAAGHERDGLGDARSVTVRELERLVAP